MAADENTLQVLIQSVLDATGYRMNDAEAKKLQQTIGQTGAAMVATGEKGKESAKGLFESHREVHKLLHTIGNDTVPGMGGAFAALARGPLGAVIALGMSIEFVKKKIDETNKQLDAMAANASKAFGGGDWLTEYVKAAADAAEETEDLAAALRKAADAGPETKNRYDAEAKAIKEVVEALREKLKAQEDDEITQARAAGKKSGASSAVIDATEADIRARYESRSKAAQDAADQALQQARAREMEERQKNDPSLKAAAAATLTPANLIQTRKGRADELAAQEAALAQATSDMNTAQNDKLHESIENLSAGLENMKRTGTRQSIVKARESEIALLESETAEARKTNAEDRIRQLSKEVAHDTEVGNKEKAAREEATNAATENAKRIVELQKEIAEANTAAKIKAETVSQLVRAFMPYEDTKTFEKTAGVDTDAGAAAFIQKFFAAQGRLGQHKGTAEDSQLVGLLNQLLQTTQQSDQRMFLLLQDLIEHKGDLNAALAELASQMKSTRRAMPSMSTTGQ